MCGKDIIVYIEKGFDYKEVTVKCGNTSPSGYPYLCVECIKIHKDRDWNMEALLDGEQWDEDY
jgi:hypothetical protein